MGDNNDGISIFDITNPLKPRYALAHLGDARSSDGGEWLPGISKVTAFHPISTFLYEAMCDIHENMYTRNTPPSIMLSKEEILDLACIGHG